MKLSVSNIAWEASEMEKYLKLLAKCYCQGMELSPAMIWEEPTKVLSSEAKKYKRWIGTFELELSSMHSLTYTRPDLNLFSSNQSREQLIQYIVDLAYLANNLEIPVMIYGSAKSRQIDGRNRNACIKIMAESFRTIAEKIKPLGVILLIEPLSREYTDSINNAHEAMDLIQLVDHPNFALHIDLKSSFIEKENYQEVWTKYCQYIKHCHVANPELNLPGPDCLEHYAAAQAIKNSGYQGYISLEVNRVNNQNDLERAIQFVREVYLK